ncbi:universal stress protein [Actinomadura keratinilytica]|jgi:nucleotide-binding universal stress UspA family protein|uniref:Universal stress protein n=1 Tax=Actinomadura keratinilytica TaxID=547461 RepID=A0ABP7Z9N4_9ACTN
MSEDGAGRPVLVGYDGSPAAEVALRWGVEEARLRGLPVTVCHAWHWPYPMRRPDEETLEILRGAGAIVADEGVRKAHALLTGEGVRRARALAGQRGGDVEVRWCLERGWAAAVLLQASRDAELVVLGLRGHGGFEGLTVGSTAVQVASRADRPVVVVGADTAHDRRDGAPIVVGVDGSPASEAALGFAFAEAALRGASLLAVCSWWDPSALPGPDRAPFVRPDKLRHEAIVRFDQAVAPWRAEYPKVPVETRFVVEKPRHALLDAADGAALLAVGDRGIGSTPQTLLGPVTQAVLQQAPCPVAVVPAPAR